MTNQLLTDELRTAIRTEVANAANAMIAQLRNGKQPELAKAYVAAWGEIDNVAKNADNPHFNRTYADLAAVLSAGKPAFAKHDLALLQAPGPLNGDKLAVTSMVLHASGEHIGFTVELPIGPKPSAQAAGSAITYARRYSAMAIFGMAPVDDDGSAATEEAPAPPPKKEKAPKEVDPNVAAEAAALIARINACTKIGKDASTTEGEIKALKPEVLKFTSTAPEVIDAYTKRATAIREASKKADK